MQQLHIENTRNTPQINFEEGGLLRITGRALIEDPIKFFAPLLEWIQGLTGNCANLEVKMDYMNTASTKMMNEFIKTFDANSKIANKVINWYFEIDDEDMQEVGEIFEENTFSTSFYFHKLAEFAA